MTHPKLARFVLGSCLITAISCHLFATEPPKPFTPVKAAPKEFRCVGRQTTLGGFLLPTQITAADKPILSAPVQLICQPNIFASLRGVSKVTSRNGDSAEWTWTGETSDVSVLSHLKADCDGFSWYEIQITPKHPLKLSSLALEIPRVAATARYLHTANYSWSNLSQGLVEMGGKWSGGFMPYIWMGDEERGLAWCAESSEGWNLQSPNHALAVKTEGDVVLFRATFLDHEQSITGPITLRFGLQASPVKPVSFQWRANARILHDIHYESMQPGSDGRCELDKLQEGGVKTVVIHDSWTRYFGQMVPTDTKKFHELIDACHKRGLRLLVYVGYGIARNAPELQGKHDEWSVLPLIPWNPAYKPETRAFDATCPKSGWADWLVAGTEKLFSDFDLDGLYFDGTSEAWICHNQAHGCGWKDAQRNLHAHHPMLAARSLMRRVADAVHRHKPNAILDVHMSSNFTLPTLSFCDSIWNGEQFEGHTSSEKFEVPLHAFRTEFMGWAHGMDAEFLCYENRPFAFDEAVALAWLHGVEVRPYPKTLEKVSPIWRAMDRFGFSKAEWHPYWKDPVASSDSDAIKISAWTRHGRALLFVSHLRRTPETVHVRVDSTKLGIKRPKAKDALNGQTLEIEGDSVELSFSGMNYRILEISR